jgi:hypothetical protein
MYFLPIKTLLINSNNVIMLLWVKINKIYTLLKEYVGLEVFKESLSKIKQ